VQVGYKDHGNGALYEVEDSEYDNTVLSPPMVVSAPKVTPDCRRDAGAKSVIAPVTK
jgi:hypothetical protein